MASLTELRIPKHKRIEFSLFVLAFDIKTVLSYQDADFLGDTYITVICETEDTEITGKLKQEKLREKWGKHITNNS